MTVKQLVEWCDKAIEMREKKENWDNPNDEFGWYKKDTQTCLTELMPEGTTCAEYSIASHLVQWGNDIQDWNSAAYQKPQEKYENQKT